MDSCFGIYAEQVELWFKNSLPGTTTIQEAILSPFDCVEADNVGAGQSAPAERAVHLAYELLSCAMIKISTVHLSFTSYLSDGALSYKRKIKKNKALFDELLNAMDTVGFLDEVNVMRNFHVSIPAQVIQQANSNCLS